tara:strand:- start:402 stop:809 length:408 start_codon:yes stop_codon:yes gene_type:complete
MQEDFLLPKKHQLVSNESDKKGITTFNTYNYSENIDLDSIGDYPIYKMGNRNWEMIKWHKPSNEELNNLKAFLQFEEVKSYFTSDIEIENVIIAYSKSIDDPELTDNQFKLHNWIELYLLETNKKKLTHISYGKF